MGRRARPRCRLARRCGPRPTLRHTNVSVTRAPSDTLAYRVSAGHIRSDALARPTGRVLVVDDPRVAGRTVGGAVFDDVLNPSAGHLKFDTRVDHQIHGGRGQTVVLRGVATPDGTTLTALGPFHVAEGALGYAKVNYDRDALSRTASPRSWTARRRACSSPISGSRTRATWPIPRWCTAAPAAIGSPAAATSGASRSTSTSPRPLRTAPKSPASSRTSSTPTVTARCSRRALTSSGPSPRRSSRRVPRAVGHRSLHGPDHRRSGRPRRPRVAAPVPPGVRAVRVERSGSRDLEGALDATTSAPFPLTTRVIGGSIPFASGAPRQGLRPGAGRLL